MTPKARKILVACEFSGRVRSQLRSRGHDAWSCDLEPADDKSPYHIQGDVFDAIKSRHWDIMIAFPPCTYLCSMGIWWNNKRPERWADTEAAIEFVQALMAAPIAQIAIENPVGILSTRIRKPDQYIQPYEHGDPFSKRTCLWLKGLPKITPTDVVDKGKFYVKKNGHRMAAWSHITSGTNKAKRAKIASTTFPGIAKSMADQWTENLTDTN